MTTVCLAQGIRDARKAPATLRGAVRQQHGRLALPAPGDVQTATGDVGKARLPGFHAVLPSGSWHCQEGSVRLWRHSFRALTQARLADRQ